MDQAPVAVYADGGVIWRNPSPYGGTWAWLWLDPDGRRCREESGLVTPEGLGIPLVTNNVTECLAVLLALEALPAGWQGTVYSDSRITLRRFRGKGGSRGLPADFPGRMVRALCRLDTVDWCLVGGHPTRKELATGRRRDGKVCSPHNVRCDELCGHQAHRFLALHGGRPPDLQTEGAMS